MEANIMRSGTIHIIRQTFVVVEMVEHQPLDAITLVLNYSRFGCLCSYSRCPFAIGLLLAKHLA